MSLSVVDVEAVLEIMGDMPPLVHRPAKDKAAGLPFMPEHSDVYDWILNGKYSYELAENIFLIAKSVGLIFDGKIFAPGGVNEDEDEYADYCDNDGNHCKYEGTTIACVEIVRGKNAGKTLIEIPERDWVLEHKKLWRVFEDMPLLCWHSPYWTQAIHDENVAYIEQLKKKKSSVCSDDVIVNLQKEHREKLKHFNKCIAQANEINRYIRTGEYRYLVASYIFDKAKDAKILKFNSEYNTWEGISLWNTK